MARTTRKVIIPNRCIKETSMINGKMYMKFKNIKSCKSAQDIIDDIPIKKVIIK